jgi:hypothetical protein
MLPGFRSLSVAVVLAVSMLIFGLGAAALLRATHEEFASLPLRQMPEVTFGSREETEQPMLAVLQVDPPNADPAEPKPDQAAAQKPPLATTDPQPKLTSIAAILALDATSAAASSVTPATSPAPSDSVSPTATDTASAHANPAESSEQPLSVVASVDAGNVTKPDLRKTTAIKTDVIKPDVGVSYVAETMTSPFGSNFRPPLPVSRPAQVADVTPSAAKPSAKPAVVAKRNRHRKVVRRSRRARSIAPNPALSPASPFASD